MDRVFNLNNRHISFSDSGKGDIIVLIHGYLETKEVWKNFSERLSKHFRVLAVDLPGHGGSDAFDEIHTMEFMADAIYLLLKSLGVGKVFLTGHSLGGYVALAFAEKYPGELSGFCLFHSHPFPDSDAALKKRKREISMIINGEKDLFYPDNVRRMFAPSNLEKLREEVERSLAIASTVSGAGIMAVLRGMMVRPSRQRILEEGMVPCLWVLGKKDNYINWAEASNKITLPPNARIAILENSGHLGFLEEEDLSVKLLTEFISVFPDSQ